MIGVSFFILELHPVRERSRRSPRGVKGCRGMPKTRPRNILNVQVFIERDHIYKKKPIYSSGAGIVRVHVKFALAQSPPVVEGWKLGEAGCSGVATVT
ncbi:hypothetical protein TNCV_2283621 [Trichonephila clavipes]|nr:hypothetical protein TNCV_2283621 [Trichonephila clavipes]